MVGNCGRLLGGLVLMPAAKVDDGLLDVVTIGPRGIIGWLAVTARVLARRREGHRIVQHWQGRTSSSARKPLSMRNSTAIRWAR